MGAPVITSIDTSPVLESANSRLPFACLDQRRHIPVNTMNLPPDLTDQLVTPNIGHDIFEFVAKLFPICRSIIGNGVRETLREIGEHMPLDIHEVATGTIV
jgi:hypothetical protein